MLVVLNHWTMICVTTSNNMSELSLYSRSVLSETPIVNSYRLSLNVPKDRVKQSLVSFTKNATCESGIVLVSLRMSKSDR
jgi:hypothetical protein